MTNTFNEEQMTRVKDHLAALERGDEITPAPDPALVALLASMPGGGLGG